MSQLYNPYIKRALDIIIAPIALALLAIPSILVAIMIKLDSSGPIIFSHTRCGRNNQPFTLYKFRTVRDDAPHHTPSRAFKNRSHFTRVGRVLRKLSIDEIPQLYNVIRGDMSIVGPRPVLYVEEDLLNIRTANGSNKIRPGITGWAQVNGRDTLNATRKAQMDAHYADSLSFKIDLRCVLTSVWVILSKTGLVEGHEQKKDSQHDNQQVGA